MRIQKRIKHGGRKASFLLTYNTLDTLTMFYAQSKIDKEIGQSPCTWKVEETTRENPEGGSCIIALPHRL